jgi:hypothetical protein
MNRQSSKQVQMDNKYSTLSHKGNANQSNIEIPSQDGYHQGTKTQQMLTRWGWDPFIHSYWEGKLVQPLWKSVWLFLKKLKIEYHTSCYTTPQHIFKRV